MMRAMRNKYNVKVVSFIVAAVFVLGIAAYAMMGMGNVAQAAPTSSIGVVDQANIMSDAEKQQYFQEMQKQFNAKQAEIHKNIQGKIDNAVKEVADKKGLSLVVDKAAVLYGGVNITGEVQTALNNALTKEAGKEQPAETKK